MTAGKEVEMTMLDMFKKSENLDNSKTAQQRKDQTERYLKSLNIPVNKHLPCIEGENDVKLRDGKEIAARILILVYLAYVAEVPDERENVIDFLKSNALWEQVSQDEKELYQKEVLTNQEAVNISWRTEAIWLLLWTISKVQKLELPQEQVEINEILARLPKFLTSPNKFIENAVLRPTSEILDASDLIYRLHWAARETDLKKQPMPASLNLSIVMERHYAINWVTFYGDEWDDILTDT